MQEIWHSKSDLKEHYVTKDPNQVFLPLDDLISLILENYSHNIHLAFFETAVCSLQGDT